MTKDRLEEMQKMMQYDESQDGNFDTQTKDKTAPLVKFFDNAKAIKLEIQNLRNKVNDLKILLNDSQQWISTSSRKGTEQKIEEQKLIIGDLAKTIRNNLKAMKTSSGDSKRISVIQRIKDVQLNTILNELNEILKDYLQCLVQHREKSVKILKNMLEVKGEKDTNIDSLLEEGKIAIFINNLLISDMEEKYNLREAEDKHKEIIKIESSIVEIKNLFNELALIVDLQSEKIDEAEKLVEENLYTVERGNVKLTSASMKRQKLRYKKIMIALICGSFILIVLVLITLM